MSETIDPLDSFLQLLSYKTVSLEGPSNGEYANCVSFLEDLCKKLSLETQVICLKENKPILIAKWIGS
jgi:hypothetical protein